MLEGTSWQTVARRARQGVLCQCASVVLSASSAPVSAAPDNRCFRPLPQEQGLLTCADREPFLLITIKVLGLKRGKLLPTWNSLLVNFHDRPTTCQLAQKGSTSRLHGVTASRPHEEDQYFDPRTSA